jgi:hypothetical protein
MQLVDWSDSSCFKEFCLDRLAIGLSPELIASDISGIVEHKIPVEHVLESCSSDEVRARREKFLSEIKDSAPVISRELLSTLNKIKRFIDLAESEFESSDKAIEDFDAYRRSLELKLKAIDTASSQIERLAESTKQAPQVLINFDFSKLKALEDEGLVKIIDVDTVKGLIGDGEDELLVKEK